VRVLKMPKQSFISGYRDGSLGIYMVEKITNKRFFAYSEKGKKYLCSHYKDKVVMYEVEA